MKEDLIKIMAQKINKNYGISVYSGTLAIESALKCLEISSQDKVLISSTVCYSIFEAIIHIGAIPIIYTPKNGFNLSEKDIIDAFLMEPDIKCIILVHQYGLVQKIKGIREVAKNIPIIEDIAQAWNIILNDEKIGEYSDIVVTSFGKTKPISLGYGGALFSNINYSDKFDFYDNESRKKQHSLLPYTFDLSYIDANQLLNNANKIVQHQRNIAKELLDCFCDFDSIYCIIDSGDDCSVWHRYPIRINNAELYEKLILNLDELNIKYQLPHDKELFELDMVKNSNAIIYNKNFIKYNWILIRTRTNKIDNIRLLKERIKGDI
ncbi:MAG: DegT/DnrJ/EryC1/StrS family aminotransferase [bacterium]|nr:DegT/DnrJ/EryC1/StrS family aminotransferase [bacterium]